MAGIRGKQVTAICRRCGDEFGTRRVRKVRYHCPGCRPAVARAKSKQRKAYMKTYQAQRIEAAAMVLAKAMLMGRNFAVGRVSDLAAHIEGPRRMALPAPSQGLPDGLPLTSPALIPPQR